MSALLLMSENLQVEKLSIMVRAIVGPSKVGQNGCQGWVVGITNLHVGGCECVVPADHTN